MAAKAKIRALLDYRRVIGPKRITRDPPDTVALAVLDDETPPRVDDRLAAGHRRVS